ncbi:MAG: hypothetical protein ACREH5_02090, partial [Candidatus Omnitrophota bacterium]
VWFPLALFLVEKFLEKDKILPLFLLAFAQSQSWLGGFPQFSAYAALFVTAYFFLRLRESARPFSRKVKVSLWFFGALALSTLIALPQLWATLELASRSTRVLYGKEFALWGSVPPWCLATLFMVSWGAFLRYKVYVGIWPLMAVLAGGFQKRFAVWWVLVGLSLFFAFGAFNPFNWMLLHLPVASLLRNPSKFLFFTAFFLAILAGFSVDSLSARSFSRAAGFLGLFAVLAIGAWVITHFGGGILLRFGRWYTESFVVGKSFHQGTPDDYLRKIESILSATRQELDLANPFFWVPFIFGALFLGWVRLQKESGKRPVMKSVFVILLALDLFLFAKFGYGTGFLGNIGPFPDVGAVERLEKDGRWLDLTREEEAVFPPNRNLLTGHAQIGAYSPLLDKDYYVLTKDFGALDDSFGRTRLSVESLRAYRSLVNLLGVKYLIAGRGQTLEGFTLLRPLNGKSIYMNPEAQGEFHLAVKRGFRSVRVLKNDPLSAAIEVDSTEGGLLVRNQLYTKDWKVRMDGKERRLERAYTVFQGVEVPKGGHRLEWSYEPDWFTVGRWFYAGGLAVVFMGILFFGVFSAKGRVG